MSGSFSPYSRRGYPDEPVPPPYYTPSPTPSPRHSSYMYSQPSYPPRPATRAHFRTTSNAFVETSSRPPAASPRYTSDGFYATKTDGGYAGFHTEQGFDDARLPRQPTKQRRSSMSTPQRPSTARPSSSHKPVPLKARVATEVDRQKHRIPQGYSLKNWDPSEPPILLLGSVFDANSLGKWIYDWTTYHLGPNNELSEMAGELWLLLIQFSGKLKGAEDVVAKVRDPKRREVLEDFIEAGPMLRASKKNGTGLGKNAGVEFVETLFGRDRELERTERFMSSLELYIKRFKANCDEILKHPTR
ncbi:unnamed protein product [Parascedosporium putredinis]|uniref:Vegetative cell wall protein gp1 n=1 Tax=Parascedosporium putredinis TaxID=1442378 RepID=A0A9P1H526_9PEZI|nr:unnamed protein product [Parascedosporium putredinis]CAI7996100.1 unnamed protein product [Parascedosporium putredinis]